MTTTTAAHPGHTASGIIHPLVRPFLLADAATTSVNGLAYLVAASWLADWFGASESLLRGLGGFLLVVGVAVTAVASRRPVPRRAVLALAGLNAGWVAASLGFAVGGGLTTLGVAWTVLQALVVAAFAAGQVWFAHRG